MPRETKWLVERSPGEEVLARAHDDKWLRARWRKWARAAGWRWEETELAHGEKIAAIISPAMLQSDEEGWYFSTGVHGDEAAATLGLLLWAEKNRPRLARAPCVMFPCLNPWGLRENSRRDGDGVDLNRIWHKADHPLRAFVDGMIAGRRFAFFATLHEDFDARGVYLYEPLLAGQPPVGERLLARIGRSLPIDPRKTIEGRPVTRPGLIQRRKIPEGLENSLPEALYLLRHQPQGGRVFTFETPSEFDLARRVVAQQLFLNALVEICG